VILVTDIHPRVLPGASDVRSGGVRDTHSS
jgi:hypothetical protein